MVSYVNQDTSRQEVTAALTGLECFDGRTGPDAFDPEDIAKSPYELKSLTPGDSTSTSRDVDLEMIAKWRTYWWIFAEGRQPVGQLFKIERLWIAHPFHLDSFFSRQEKKIKTFLENKDAVLALVKKYEPERLARTIWQLDHGSKLNCPQISYAELEVCCTELPIREAVKARRDFVAKFPLSKNINKPGYCTWDEAE